jgi:hypothetical protein
VRAPWPVTIVVSFLPVLVLVMGTALAHMLHAGAEVAVTCPMRQGEASSGPGQAEGPGLD